MTNREFFTQFAYAIACLVIGGLLLVVLYVALLPSFDEKFASASTRERAEPLLISGAQFQPRLSGGSIFERNELVITKLKNGEAIMASDTLFDAEDYAFAHFSARGQQPGLKVFLFWQTVERPNGVFYAQVPLAPGGSGWFNLKRENLWQGTIRKIEIGVFGDLREGHFSLESLEFHPYGAKGVMGTVATEWREFRPWTHASINAYLGVGAGALISPVTFVSMLLSVSLILAGVIFWAVNALPTNKLVFKPPSIHSIFKILATACWLTLTLIWLSHLALQNKETRRSFSGKGTHERKLADWDGASYYRLAVAIKAANPVAEQKLAILVAEDGTQIDMAYRLRYHLFPELKADSVSLAERENIEKVIQTHQQVLVFSPSKTSKANVLAMMQSAGITLGKNVSIISDHALGVLLNVQNIEAPGVPIIKPIDTHPVKSDR